MSFPDNAARLKELVVVRKEEGLRDDRCEWWERNSYLYFYDEAKRKIDKVSIKKTSWKKQRQLIADNEEIIGYHGGIFDKKAKV